MASKITTAATRKPTYKELLSALATVVNAATRTQGTDSTGREYAHIRQVALEVGRDAMRRAGLKTNER